jgi:hypothetical protein
LWRTRFGGGHGPVVRADNRMKHAVSVRPTFCEVKVKVNESHYRPGQALRVPGSWGSQILRQSAHKSDKIVSSTHRPPYPTGSIPGTHFCYRLSRPQGHIVRPDGLCEWKIPVTPSGIEPATFRLLKLLSTKHCSL